MSEPDPLNSIETLMSTNWIPGNTGGSTPIFFIDTQQSNVFEYCNGETYMLIYGPTHTTKPNGLGADFNEETTDRVSMDIRTKVSRDRMLDMYNEARRIVRANTNNPDANYAQLISFGYQNFPSINFFRRVYDVRLKNWNQGD